MKLSILIAVIIFVGVILVAAVQFLIAGKSEESARELEFDDAVVRIGNAEFSVAVADTLVSRSHGLSDVAEMDEDEGMLFEFASSSRHTFWMKGMRFPLDMVWIQDDAVVGVTENIPPPESGMNLSSLKTYGPPEKVNKVLEVHAGKARESGIEAGDSVEVIVSQ